MMMMIKIMLRVMRMAVYKYALRLLLLLMMKVIAIPIRVVVLTVMLVRYARRLSDAGVQRRRWKPFPGDVHDCAWRPNQAMDLHGNKRAAGVGH
jgi:hypothetical protein